MKMIYLAVPYTGIAPSAFFQVTRAMALILKEGEVNIFSPITHSHPLTQYNMPQNWEFWEQIDYDFLDRVDGMYVLIPEEGLERVRKSTGVQAEIKYAKKIGLPINFIQFHRMGDGTEKMTTWTDGEVEALKLLDGEDK